jgi:hypothetical protein
LRTFPSAATLSARGISFVLKGSAYVLILVVLGLAMLAGAVGGAWESFPPAAYAASIEPVRPGQENSIRRAVFADGRIWLLSDAGAVWTVREDAADAQQIALPGLALDICVQRGLPIIATAPQAHATAWTLWRWQGGRWADAAAIPVEDDGLVAITCEPDRLTLLTSRRIVELAGPRRRVVMLSNRVPSQPMSVVLAAPAHVFVGLNAGEWGGGLQRIDRRTGEVRRLESNVSGELCGGPLNTDCDPVNGIAPSPWKPGCVVAAVGLIHMTGRGRLVEVCEDRITNIHTEPCPSERSGKAGAPFCTMPFFGIIEAGGRLLAVAPGELVSLDGSGRASHLPAPRLRPYGPFQVSFTPDYVLLNTSANERHSVSGLTPLLASR